MSPNRVIASHKFFCKICYFLPAIKRKIAATLALLFIIVTNTIPADAINIARNDKMVQIIVTVRHPAISVSFKV